MTKKKSKAKLKLKPKQNSIPVCYLVQGTDRIEWGNVEKIEPGQRVRFEDGGWNPADSCFLTEKQCREHHRLVPEKWQNLRIALADKLEDMAQEVRETF